MANLTAEYCYAQHKAAFESWQYGKPVEHKHDGDILIIKYQNGTWFHYKFENNSLIWW